mgnify:CR=1 FL=1
MGCLIHVRTAGEIRENENPEVAEFVRAARKSRLLPNYRDDKPHARGGNSKPKHKDHR